jgi:hypothetical protein
MELTLKSPGIVRLKPHNYKLLSNAGSNYNSRRCTTARYAADVANEPPRWEVEAGGVLTTNPFKRRSIDHPPRLFNLAQSS